jgi:hypothetical protein
VFDELAVRLPCLESHTVILAWKSAANLKRAHSLWFLLMGRSSLVIGVAYAGVGWNSRGSPFQLTRGETRHLSTTAVHQSRSKCFFFPLTCIVVVSGFRGGCIPHHPFIFPTSCHFYKYRTWSIKRCNGTALSKIVPYQPCTICIRIFTVIVTTPLTRFLASIETFSCCMRRAC